MKKQIHVLYSGRVQGVGFRFTAESLASGSGVKGWVKNLPDGRVEIAAEADEEKLKVFLEKIKDAFSGYIQDADVDWREPTGEFQGFGVRF